jgi:hypothetical protein
LLNHQELADQPVLIRQFFWDREESGRDASALRTIKLVWARLLVSLASWAN